MIVSTYDSKLHASGKHTTHTSASSHLVLHCRGHPRGHDSPWRSCATSLPQYRLDLYVYICAYMNMWLYTHMNICTFSYVRSCATSPRPVYMYVCTYVSMYICMYSCILVWIYVYVHMYVLMYTCTNICIWVPPLCLRAASTCMYVYVHTWIYD